MTGVTRLIEKQAAMQGLKDRLEHPITRGEGYRETGYGPCLLISRECASGGSLVARTAGARLGWQVYDSEIVDEIARVEHERQRLVASVDERVVSSWERAWQDVLMNIGPVDTRYLHGLRQVVLSLGHHGNAVMVGRGAQYFLPAECALRVRFVAPLSWRAKRLSAFGGLTEAAARVQVEQTDASRAAFIWHNFHQRADSPLNYELVINTAETGFERATAMVVWAVQQKFGVAPVDELKREMKLNRDANIPLS